MRRVYRGAEPSHSGGPRAGLMCGGSDSTLAFAPNRPAASQGAVVRRSAAPEALDWLRERPIALIAAVLACVLLIAFAPWRWRASFDF